jgi:CRP-like cAMP-binding protein
MNDVIEQLSSMDIFSTLDRNALNYLALRCSVLDYPSAQTVIACGEYGAEVFFIVSGLLRATLLTPQGREISYQDLQPGEMFGELAAIDRGPRTTHVITQQPSRLLMISGDTFTDLLARYPQVSAATLHKMAAMVRSLCERVYNYSALDVTRRVRAELLRLACSLPRSDRTQAVPGEIKNMPKHQELANRLATHREAVSRELTALEKAGIIARHKDSVLIHDIETLQYMVND